MLTQYIRKPFKEKEGSQEKGETLYPYSITVPGVLNVIYFRSICRFMLYIRFGKILNTMSSNNFCAYTPFSGSLYSRTRPALFLICSLSRFSSEESVCSVRYLHSDSIECICLLTLRKLQQLCSLQVLGNYSFPSLAEFHPTYLQLSEIFSFRLKGTPLQIFFFCFYHIRILVGFLNYCIIEKNALFVNGSLRFLEKYQNFQEKRLHLFLKNLVIIS